MGSLTDYAESIVLGHVLGTTAYSHVATTYLALVTADPSDTADAAFMAANEVATADTGYERQAITWNAASSRTITNNGAITFTQSGGTGFGTVHGVCIMDSGTEGAGNVLAWAVVDEKAVGVGETYTVATTALSVVVDASGSGGGAHTTFVTELLDFIFRNTDIADVDGTTNPWVALFTTNPSDAADGTEVSASGTGYARIQDAFGAAGAAMDNDTLLEWTCAGSTMGTVTGAGVMKTTTETTADCMFWADFSSDAVVGVGDKLQIAAGAFDVTLS
jgi:hypothetical protein